MTAGNPISDLAQRFWITVFCTLPEGEPEDFEQCLAGESEEIYFANRNSLLGDIMLALDLDKTPDEEWSRYEKRRMLRLSKRLEEIGKEGLVDYLTRIASTDSIAILTLLGKILPRPYVHKKDNYITAEELEEALRERGLPLDLLKESILMSKVRRDGRPEVEADQAYLSGSY
jgi:hypothetical protein